MGYGMFGVNRSMRASHVLGVLSLLAVFGGYSLLAPTYGAAQSEETLKLDRHRLTFDEEFDKLDVTAKGPRSRWIAHTPWNGDFGEARFIDPEPERPFSVNNGLLNITMSKRNGEWISGLLAANNHDKTGFSQRGGYFEARMKLPGGAGVWPGFWLGAIVDEGQTAPEIDIVEYYGHDSTTYMVTTHLWKDNKDHGGKAIPIKVEKGTLEERFHTFGVNVTAKTIGFYLDRKLVASTPSSPEFMVPLYPLVNLAAGGGWPIDHMPEHSTLQVDYIRVYRDGLYR